MRYLLVSWVNVVIGLIASAVLVEDARIPYGYAIAIVGVVFAPLTYVIHRVWTFGMSWVRAH